MKTLEVIQYIAEHPEYTNIVIGDNDDMTPVCAVAYLARMIVPSLENSLWRVQDGEGERGTLLIY